MPATTSTIKSRISAAAFRLVAQKGWKFLTLEHVAKQAKVSLDVLKTHAKNPAEIALLIAEEIDREAFTSSGKLSGAPRDILFELLMARFDILQKHRKAILSMTEAASTDRHLSCILVRATMEGAYRVAAAANIKKPPRPVVATGVAVIYGWAYLIWRKDRSQDMAKTMAALDKGLRLSENLLKLIPQQSAG